jgi:group II intron reverse transcriptase/maturase/CRISPR-associated endonuclease Cas1
MQKQPNIVTILGSTHSAVEIIFRRVFEHNTCPGTILVLDYMGRGAAILSWLNKMSMLKKNIHWFDINDRRHTLQLLEIDNATHAKEILERIIHLFIGITNVFISPTTIGWFVNTAIKFIENGRLHLTTLLRFLGEKEVKKLYLDSSTSQEEIASLQKLLTWVLRFPSVYSICEGVNQIRLENCFSEKTVIWIELMYEHLERSEHHLVSGLVDIIAENSIKKFFHSNTKSKLDFTVLHVYPPMKPFLEFPEWIKSFPTNNGNNSRNIRNISIHNFLPTKPLRKNAIDWINASDNVWIVGKIEGLKREIHHSWLTDSEMNLIDNLERGKVWIKSNKTGKAIIANIRIGEEPLALSYKLRVQSNQKRKSTSILQMSTEVDSLDKRNNEYSGLYKKLYDIDFLKQGWFRVKEGKKDSHGIDKVTIKEYGENIERELSELQHQLRNKKYRCRPLRRIYIEKPEGGMRGLGVACVRDRVVQTTCLMLLEPFFEPDFSNYSFAYRPRRNAHHALNVLRSRIKTGYEWVITADIKKCFDSIDHNVLLDLLARKISDSDLLVLIKHWLDVDILEFGALMPTIVGVPQGESLSPLFSNIYLDKLDKHFENLGYQFVRYADDILVQTKTKQEAERALLVMQNFLMEPLHLEIKESKTNIAFVGEGIEFLGFRIDKDGLSIRDKKIKHVQDALENYIKKLGDKDSTIDDINKMLLKINASIRGFRNYFLMPDEPAIHKQLELMDGYIEGLAKSFLPIVIQDDPAWICRERFCVSKNENDFENYEEEVERKSKTENGYPVENIHGIDMPGLIYDEQDEKTSVIVEDLENETIRNLRDSVFELDKRLYVMTHGSYLTNEEDFLIIRKRKKEIARYKMNELGLVFLQGAGMNISVSLQLKLAELDIPIVFAPTVGTPLAVVNTILSSKSNLRKLQVTRRDDEDIIATGLEMLNAKVTNQASLLKYFYKYRKRKESSSVLQIQKDVGSMEELAKMISRLDCKNEDVRAIAMGYEGHAASIYWQNIKKLLPSDFDFVGRITRTAKDIVNQCFNYVYGLLYGEVWRAVVKAGLDPYFGFIHGSQRDGGSMIFDIIEEFRSPFADRIVIGMFGRGFKPEINKSGMLKTTCKKSLAKSFSKRWHKKVKWRSLNLSAAQILGHQAISISKVLTTEGKYFPYRMKW